MSELPDRPSYLRYAFANVYNLSLLGGAAVASAATQDWAIAVIAGGVEALWLAIGADTAPFRRWVDRQHREKAARAHRDARRARIIALPGPERERAIELVAAHIGMGRELEKNEHWTGDLVRDEYARLDELLDSFVELAEAATRLDAYGRQYDVQKLRKELSRHQQLAAAPGDEEARSLAARNADLVQKRIVGLEEMARLVQRTRGQMSVIENSFSLLRDQIVSLKPPQDIKGQLDEIVAGVAAVRSVLAEGNGTLEAVAEAPAEVAPSEPEPAGPAGSGARPRGRLR